jgi:hypothetical protein
MMMWLALSRSASGFPIPKAVCRIRTYSPGFCHPNWHAEIGAHNVAGQCFADYFRPFFKGLSKKSTFLETPLACQSFRGYIHSSHIAVKTIEVLGHKRTYCAVRALTAASSRH